MTIRGRNLLEGRSARLIGVPSLESFPFINEPQAIGSIMGTLSYGLTH